MFSYKFVCYFLIFVFCFKLVVAFDYDYNGILKPNYSNEDFEEIWDLIFKESSSGTYISSDVPWNGSIMYKIDENFIYVLIIKIQESIESNEPKLSAEIMGVYGNFSDDILEIIKNGDSSEREGLFEYPVFEGVVGNRNINNTLEANNIYNSYFKMQNNSWVYKDFQDMSTVYPSFTYYSEEGLKTREAIILKNNLANYLRYTEKVGLNNEELSFSKDDCGYSLWYVGSKFRLDLKKCFSHINSSKELVYRYYNPEDYNISIIKNGTDYFIESKNNWTGYGYFYVFANDSVNEVKGEVRFNILKKKELSEINSFNGDEESKLITPFPDSNSLSLLSGESYKLNISEDGFDSVKWYLEGELISEENSSFDLTDFESGIYTVRVDVIKGNLVDSKTWSVIITEDPIIKEKGIGLGETIFYTFVVVMIIIILLVIYFLIIEKRKMEQTSSFLE